MKIQYFLSAALVGVSMNALAATPLYKKADAPVEDRVSDLLQRMTIDEKIGQVSCPMGWEMYTKTKKGVVASDKYKEMMQKAPIGSFWAVLRADPWTQKTLENGLSAEEGAIALNALQKYAVTETRLGIPVLFAEECPHGHMAIGSTVFPTSLSQASTWNDSLIYYMGDAIALETRAQGANVGYGPVLDIARDPRWSRVEETFGEDPVLTGTLGSAFVKGMQGTNAADGKHIYSTLKHFTAYGMPEGGHNGARATTGMRQLFSEYMPAFKKCVEAGAATIMTSYNAIDGVPCTSNKYLLDDVLRQKWGFDGVIYSDLYSIDGIAGMRVAADNKEAAALALKAGVDLDLGANAYTNNLKKALEEGLVSEAELDKAVANVLRLKFKMGLFENPYVDAKAAKKIVHNDNHVALARKVAAQGTVLLKNNGVLPLKKDIKTIAVIGPNADVMYNQLGDYTSPQDSAQIVTIRRGIQQAVSAGTKVVYVKGCAIRDTAQTDIAAAVAAAKSADAVVLALGGSSARDFKTKYIDTGAAVADEKAVSDMDCGEGYDRSTLDLLGDQIALLNAVAATGRPLVVVYVQGRPLDMTVANEKADALLTAWYPGEQGGNAVADILFGDVNPAGRLPISIPRAVGQIPVYYSQSSDHAYVENPSSPLFAFGYGLSYTTFSYSNLTLTAGSGDVLQKVSCTVTNTGDRDGDEVVQLYITDNVASVALPPVLLKAFKRITLKKGETKTVTFNLTKDDLSIYNFNLEQVVEPGTFTAKVGASSADIRLTGTFTL
jgi:beta-glucosidase